MSNTSSGQLDIRVTITDEFGQMAIATLGYFYLAQGRQSTPPTQITC